MTIERKVKYVASDGTEHDSPQAAARYDLRLDICRASGLPRYQAETTARYLADNPEALRDAVNAYFEALEEHADTDLPPCKWNPSDALKGVTISAPQEPLHPSGLVLTDKAREMTPENPHATVYDWLAQGWDQGEMIKYGFAVSTLEDVEPTFGAGGDYCDGEHLAPACIDPQCWLKQPLKDGESAQGVRGFEMVVPAGSMFPPRSVDVSPLGDPNDPSTWRAELPVDHPNYCKPFGSNKEDV